MFIRKQMKGSLGIFYVIKVGVWFIGLCNLDDEASNKEPSKNWDDIKKKKKPTTTNGTYACRFYYYRPCSRYCLTVHPLQRCITHIRDVRRSFAHALAICTPGSYPFEKWYYVFPCTFDALKTSFRVLHCRYVVGVRWDSARAIVKIAKITCLLRTYTRWYDKYKHTLDRLIGREGGKKLLRVYTYKKKQNKRERKKTETDARYRVSNRSEKQGSLLSDGGGCRKNGE